MMVASARGTRKRSSAFSSGSGSFSRPVGRIGAAKLAEPNSPYLSGQDSLSRQARPSYASRSPLDLLVQTKALQERRCLGILHGRVLRGLFLCACILRHWNLSPCNLLPLDLCFGLLNVPDFCPRILRGPGLSVRLHGLLSCCVIFLDLRWSSLYGLYGLLCPCISVGRRPSLELPEQGFR